MTSGTVGILAYKLVLSRDVFELFFANALGIVDQIGANTKLPPAVVLWHVK